MSDVEIAVRVAVASAEFDEAMNRIAAVFTDPMWTDPDPRTEAGRDLWQRYGDDLTPGRRRDLGQRICAIEAEMLPGPNASPWTIWRGTCGHVWDRHDEDTDICPRCAG